MYLRNQEGQLVPENVSTGPSVTGPSVLSHWIISLTEWGGLSGAMFCYEVESQYRAAAAGCRFWK